MSWDGWLTAFGDCHHACIYGPDGTVYAENNIGKNPSPDVKKIKEQSKTADDSLAGNGIEIMGLKFAFVRKDTTSENLPIYIFRGKEPHKQKSLVLCPTNSTVVCGCSKDAGQTGADIRQKVEYVAHKLVEAGC